MRLVSYRDGGSLRPGVLIEELVVDAGAAIGAAGQAPAGADPIRQALAASAAERGALAAAAAELAAAGGEPVRALADLALGPPIGDPAKVICLGLNYRQHTEEMEFEIPKAPTLFAKFSNALVGHGEAIVLPEPSNEVDYEGELAVVIGRRAKNVAAAEALDHVGGYMPLNDISARDLQMETTQWTAGKIPDTFAPCGPALVTADEVPDPQALRITSRVNGEVVQSASTAEMIFDVATTIAFITDLVTLEPGDVIATGTPAGVGYKRKPPLFLAAGDEVEVEIDGLGTLRNPVVAEAEVALAGGAR